MEKSKQGQKNLRFDWKLSERREWARRDLNSRPPGYQPGAPTNLSYGPNEGTYYCFPIKNYIKSNDCFFYLDFYLRERSISPISIIHDSSTRLSKSGGTR